MAADNQNLFDNVLTASSWHYDFQNINAPWAVSREAWEITSPKGATAFIADSQSGIEKILVASGEQSFFELMLKRALIPGKYKCITPCFRDDKETLLKKPYFLKLELINSLDTSVQALETVIKNCLGFFRLRLDAKVVQTDQSTIDPLAVSDTFDIVSENLEIELGSYGIREHPKLGRWIYATGCAEPRLTTAVVLESIAKTWIF